MHTIDQKVLTTTLATATLIGAMYWQAQGPAMPRTNTFAQEQNVQEPEVVEQEANVQPEIQPLATIDVASNQDDERQSDDLFDAAQYQSDAVDPS